MFYVLDRHGLVQAECGSEMGALRVLDAMAQRGRWARVTETPNAPNDCAIVDPQGQLRSSNVSTSSPMSPT